MNRKSKEQRRQNLHEALEKGKVNAADLKGKTVFTPEEMQLIAKSEEKRFAKGINFYKLFWIFFIGSFLGVILETVFIFITQHQWQSRVGLIYGPFNLVYGFGALIMTLGLYKIRTARDGYVFAAGAVIGAAFEYFCSWIQEKLFGTVSWDYSDMRFNLNGRVNLLFTFFWGILAVLWVKALLPRMEILILKIPNALGKTLTWILFAFMLFNTVASALAVVCWVKSDAGLPPQNAVESYFYKHYTDERMRRIYPSMTFDSDTAAKSWTHIAGDAAPSDAANSET